MFAASKTASVATGAVTQAEAVDFDGTNDYLSRASDMTGNISSKTFTFSCWFWWDGSSNANIYTAGNGTPFSVYVEGSTRRVYFYATGTTLNKYASLPVISKDTFISVVASMDMASGAAQIYVNDTSATVAGSSSNANIVFAQTTHGVAASSSGATPYLGRLSNLFLDYTYRDLSVTANRRLFVTADLKPAAGQATLNPILYLPMSDPTQPGKNSGTGGNFTLTGVVARSGRGPNQYNAPYSTLNGSTQYLSRTTALSGVADGKTFTVNLNFIFTSGTTKYIVTFGSYTVSILVNSSNSLNISATNAAGTQILLVTTPNNSLVSNRNYTLTASIDLANTSNRSVYLNGVAQSVTWSIYTNDTINFNLATPSYIVGRNISTTYFNGKIGAFWFNTSYIDLSVASNLAKFVSGTGINAAPADLGATGELPTGTSPLIYLPMYGNNAGKNYGTGGDFTENAGPYAGTRGPNEFWGNKANFGNSTSNYLSKATALTGNAGSVTTATFCCYFYVNDTTTNKTLFGFGSAASGTWQIIADKIFVYLGSGYVQFNESVSSGTWNSLLFSRSGTTITAYLNGAVLTIDTPNSSSYGGAIDFSVTPVNAAVRNSGSSTSEPLNGQLSELYLSSTYIDFSQEANRLKFRDCFGNPVNLSAQITAQAISNPIVYIRFDPSSQGANSGTGGNFTKTGTITDGGQL